MSIVDPNNRPQRPDCTIAVIVGAWFKYCDMEEVGDDVTGFWNMLFEYWTAPFPVKPPKPYHNSESPWLMTYCQEGWLEDWNPGWWDNLADTFMFPEYVNRIGRP